MVEEPAGIVVNGVKVADVSGNTVVGFKTGIKTSQIDELKLNDNFVDSGKMDDGPANSRDQWYKKPIGILVLSVLSIVLGAIAVTWLSHNFHWIKP